VDIDADPGLKRRARLRLDQYVGIAVECVLRREVLVVEERLTRGLDSLPQTLRTGRVLVLEPRVAALHLLEAEKRLVRLGALAGVIALPRGGLIRLELPPRFLRIGSQHDPHFLARQVPLTG